LDAGLLSGNGGSKLHQLGHLTRKAAESGDSIDGDTISD
jgi:hypothetical protein